MKQNQVMKNIKGQKRVGQGAIKQKGKKVAMPLPKKVKEIEEVIEEEDDANSSMDEEAPTLGPLKSNNLKKKNGLTAQSEEEEEQEEDDEGQDFDEEDADNDVEDDDEEVDSDQEQDEDDVNTADEEDCEEVDSDGIEEVDTDGGEEESDDQMDMEDEVEAEAEVDTENVEQETEENEEPSVLPINKTPIVKDGRIPDKYPLSKVVHVRKISPFATRIDVMETFGQVGPLDIVHLQETKLNYSVADIAFKNPKDSKYVLESETQWEVKGEPVEVYAKLPSQRLTVAQKRDEAIKNRERTVHVKGLNVKITESKLRTHFDEFGTIEKIHLIKKRTVAFAFILYEDKEMATRALKLHNTVLGGNTISVKACMNKEEMGPPQRDPKLTIIVKNCEDLKAVEGSRLEAIFSKCGQIDSMDVICRKSALAFITFTSEDAVTEAHKLNGKTDQGLLLEIAPYDPDKSKTSIFVSNVAKDATVDDLKELFSKSGEVTAVILKRGFAIVHFKDSDAFCKSFLLNESIIKNQMIFLEPHSVKKQVVFNQKKAMKRPFMMMQRPNSKKNFKFHPNGAGPKRAKVNT